MSQPHTYMHLLPCLSRWQVRRSVHIQNKLFPQLGIKDVEFWNPSWYTTTSASSSMKPTKKYLQRLLVPLAFATAKSAPLFSWVPSPPKNVGSSGQQMSWHRVESDFFVRHGEGKRPRLPSTRACSTVNASSWKWNAGAAAPGAVEGRAWITVYSVDCARSPYWESTFKWNRPSFAVLLVLRGGGGAMKTFFFLFFLSSFLFLSFLL